MCYGDTITIEVKAINHGIVDLNNATQVIEAVNEGSAVARVVGVEHWAEPAASVGALEGLIVALGLLAFSAVGLFLLDRYFWNKD